MSSSRRLRLGRRLTLVSAPAGFGKTTLLGDWVSNCVRPVAWVSLEERVLTLFMSVTGITTPLGLAIAGPVGDTLGVQPWFLIAGIVTLVTGLCALLIPAIIHLEDRETQVVEKPLPASA